MLTRMGRSEHTEVERSIGIDVAKDTLDRGDPSRDMLPVSDDKAGRCSADKP